MSEVAPDDDGTAIIGTLLMQSAPLLAVVAADDIMKGQLSSEFMVPGLLIRMISSVENVAKLAEEPTELIVERISITVKARTYAQQRRVIRLVHSACANKTAEAIGGCRAVSVVPAGIGPDLIGPSGTFDQNIDFRVSFERDA